MNAIYRLDVKDSFHIIVFCFYILQNIQKEITNPTAIRSICANIQIYMDLQPNIISGGTSYLICMDLSLWVLNKKKGLIKKRENDFFITLPQEQLSCDVSHIAHHQPATSKFAFHQRNENRRTNPSQSRQSYGQNPYRISYKILYRREQISYLNFSFWMFFYQTPSLTLRNMDSNHRPLSFGKCSNQLSYSGKDNCC